MWKKLLFYKTNKLGLKVNEQMARLCYLGIKKKDKRKNYRYSFEIVKEFTYFGTLLMARNKLNLEINELMHLIKLVMLSCH
jgi:hypothetical protein